MTPHNVYTCGILRESYDTDGHQIVKITTCVCGRSATERLTPEWKPTVENDPVCPRCHRPAKGNLIRLDDGLVHGACARDNPKWPLERDEALRADWNAGVPVPTLLTRFEITRAALDRRLWVLRHEKGWELAERRGRWHRPPKGPSEQAREAHALTAAGSFHRVQVG